MTWNGNKYVCVFCRDKGLTECDNGALCAYTHSPKESHPNPPVAPVREAESTEQVNHVTTGYWLHLPTQPMGEWHGSCSCGTTWITNEIVKGCPRDSLADRVSKVAGYVESMPYWMKVGGYSLEDENRPPWVNLKESEAVREVAVDVSEAKTMTFTGDEIKYVNPSYAAALEAKLKPESTPTQNVQDLRLLDPQFEEFGVGFDGELLAYPTAEPTPVHAAPGFIGEYKEFVIKAHADDYVDPSSTLANPPTTSVREAPIRKCPTGCDFSDRNMGEECLNCANTDRSYAANPPVAPVREAEENPWLTAAMYAQQALESIKHSMYCMPPSQYQMMCHAIREIRQLWEPELERRRQAGGFYDKYTR